MTDPIATFPKTATMAAEDHGIEICHPTHGWVPVVVVNASEFAVSTSTEHIWYSLSNTTVSAWPMRKAGAFVKWMNRASGA